MVIVDERILIAQRVASFKTTRNVQHKVTHRRTVVADKVLVIVTIDAHTLVAVNLARLDELVNKNLLEDIVLPH